MKSFHSLTAAVSLLVLSLAFGWLTGGCASPPGGSAAPKPGRGIAEYRAVARAAHQATAAAVKTLEALAQPPLQTSLSHPALPGFDRAFRHLELASIKARARAEAITVRGQAYFEEWKGNLAAVTHPSDALAATNRYVRLRDHFERVRERSGEVRDEFRPFMAKLREFRARLGKFPVPSNEASAQRELDGLIDRGRRVPGSLESLSQALDDADAELKATIRSERKKGNSR